MWDQFSDEFFIGVLIVAGIVLPAGIAALIAWAEMKREQKDWMS